MLFFVVSKLLIIANSPNANTALQNVTDVLIQLTTVYATTTSYAILNETPTTALNTPLQFRVHYATNHWLPQNLII